MRGWFLRDGLQWIAYCISTRTIAENIAIIEGTTTAADEWVQVAAVMPVAVSVEVLRPKPTDLFMSTSKVLRAVMPRDIASVTADVAAV